jgi:hypothetical protein
MKKAMRVEIGHSDYKKAICTSTSNFSCLSKILYFVPGFEKLFPSVAIPKTKIRLLHLGDVILEKVFSYIKYAFYGLFLHS